MSIKRLVPLNVFSAASAPSGSHSTGDMYYNTSDGILYVHTGSAWVATGGGSAGGADGLSAYEVAVADGFVGDETSWLASLVGATGAAGATGLGLEPKIFTGINVDTALAVGASIVGFGYRTSLSPWAAGQYVTFSDNNSSLVYTGRLAFTFAGGFGYAWGLSPVTVVSGSSASPTSDNWTMAFAAAPAGATGPAGADSTVPGPAVLWNFRGAWVNGIDYAAGDVVEFDGSSYYTETGVYSSFSPAYPGVDWVLVASKGSTGSAGSGGGSVSDVFLLMGA